MDKECVDKIIKDLAVEIKNWEISKRSLIRISLSLMTIILMTWYGLCLFNYFQLLDFLWLQDIVTAYY